MMEGSGTLESQLEATKVSILVHNALAVFSELISDYIKMLHKFSANGHEGKMPC